MTIILIGSRAAKAWFDDFREPKDWDAIADIETIFQWSDKNREYIKDLIPKSDRKLKCRLKDGTSIEFEVDDVKSTQILRNLSATFRPTAFPCGAEAWAATPNILWLTKRSHLFWAIHWDKNIADMHWIKDRTEIEPSADEIEYYAARLSEHKARFKITKTNLNMSNDAFFAKSAKIGRVIDHDRLHELVAYNDRPLFERFKTDLSSALLNRSLFEQAPWHDRCNLVREEAMVIALERYIIPALPKYTDPITAYHKALKRICTTLTSGWFRDFAIDHWTNFNKPDKDFLSPYLEEIAR